jgi:hypothetical protein
MAQEFQMVNGDGVRFNRIFGDGVLDSIILAIQNLI